MKEGTGEIPGVIPREFLVKQDLPGVTDPRVPQILAIAAGYYPDRDHFCQVARISHQFYRQLVPLHRCSGDAATLLFLAALLHDTGWCGGGKGHHKRSAAIIRDDPALPLSQRERDVCSLIARYHRNALPSLSHPDFAGLDKNGRLLVSRLAAHHRIADALDISHRNAVTAVRLEEEGGGICATCYTRGPVPAEAAAVRKKRDLFQSVYKCPFHTRFLQVTVAGEDTV